MARWGRRHDCRYHPQDDRRGGHNVPGLLGIERREGSGGSRGRGCDCEPYEDVFTFGRWIAQGRVVQKGEKGIQLPVVIHGTKETKAGGVEEITLLRRSYVFCRCQTTELEKSGTR